MPTYIYLSLLLDLDQPLYPVQVPQINMNKVILLFLGLFLNRLPTTFTYLQLIFSLILSTFPNWLSLSIIIIST